MVVLVRAEVLGELVDARGEQRDQDLGGAGVVLVAPELAHDLALVFECQRHGRRNRSSKAVAAGPVVRGRSWPALRGWRPPLSYAGAGHGLVANPASVL